jgi:hypothetical protein
MKVIDQMFHNVSEDRGAAGAKPLNMRADWSGSDPRSKSAFESLNASWSGVGQMDPSITEALCATEGR